MTQTKFQTHNRKTTQRPNHDAKQHNKNINRKNTRRPTTAKKKKLKTNNQNTTFKNPQPAQGTSKTENPKFPNGKVNEKRKSLFT